MIGNKVMNNLKLPLRIEWYLNKDGIDDIIQLTITNFGWFNGSFEFEITYDDGIVELMPVWMFQNLATDYIIYPSNQSENMKKWRKVKKKNELARQQNYESHRIPQKV